MRSACRLTGAAKKTVERLLVIAGEACLKFHDKTVVNVNSKLVQVDEIWSFTYAKEKNVPFTKRKGQEGVGDTWTWTGFDADSKLLIAFRVGSRDATRSLIIDTCPFAWAVVGNRNQPNRNERYTND